MIRRTALLIFVALVAVACSTSAPPERAAYLLRAQASPDLAPADPDAMVGLTQVMIAPYLDRAGLVVAVGANQVREAQHHVWAEPLDRGIQTYLVARISALVGRELNTGFGAESTWRYRIDVKLDEFHGAVDGNVKIAGRWALVDRKERRALAGSRFTRSLPQHGKGYSGLVATQAALLDKLAQVIADALGDLPPSPPPKSPPPKASD
jgi:uncharacterized lipoprotein YmbA